jgi:ribulose-phosphate 3-epimerase
MSVNPGFSGQSFLPHVLNKARHLRRMISDSRQDVIIEMDGGIGPGNIRQAELAGVDVCVAGSATFAAPDPIEALNRMRRNAKQDEA